MEHSFELLNQRIREIEIEADGIMLFGLMLVGLFFMLLYYRNILLQLQIHPHFLYNSLSYIVTVADNPGAVTQMAMHLSNYYRYYTVHKSITIVGEEISYARAYLSIMALRRQIEYEIQMPGEFEGVGIIPLVLQPIIENAIEHGIEERENAKRILVKVSEVPGGSLRFEVSDDGNGLTDTVRRRENTERPNGGHKRQGGKQKWEP